MAGLCGTFPEVTLAQVFFCFFLVSVNLSLRLVVVFQGMPAWNYLESNISRSFVLQDPQRSVSCIFKTLLSPALLVLLESVKDHCCMNNIVLWLTAQKHLAYRLLFLM